MASLSSYRYIIIDVDGVLRRAKQALPGATEFLPWLASRGINYRIATNNSMTTLAQYKVTLAAMGIMTDESHVVSSATGTAWYLKRLAPKGGRVYIIGGDGIHDAVLQDGLFTLDDQRADFVVVGLDKAFTYEKLARAMALIRGGARFVATNTDTTYPQEVGLVPGAGSIVAAVQACAGVDPVVIGKPGPILLDMALDMMKAPREQTVVLGDRLDTDIAGAAAANMDSIMVLTGISTLADVKTSPVKPTHIFNDLPELLRAWK